MEKKNIKRSVKKLETIKDIGSSFYKKHLEKNTDIEKISNESLKEATKTIDFKGKKIDLIQKYINVKPISKEAKLHNLIMINYKGMSKKNFNNNILKRINLMENLYHLKSDNQKIFYQIMGQCKLHSHMDLLTVIDKKRIRIIYNDAISLICSFVEKKV